MAKKASILQRVPILTTTQPGSVERKAHNPCRMVPVRSKTPSGPRWVGFDMDECLGSFMSLWAFCSVLPEQARFSNDTKHAYLQAVANKLAFSTRIWILRPHLDPMLEALVHAKERGAIEGCFILTNNGSPEIAEVVQRMLNIRAQRFAKDQQIPLFVAAWHRYTPCRRKTGSILAKNLHCIQECLASAGLPTLTSTKDLLFFDDFPDHELAKEIPHYVTVKAYTHYTPITLIYYDLKQVIASFAVDTEILKRVLGMAESYEERDLKTDTSLLKYSPANSNTLSFSLVGPVEKFLYSTPTSMTKRSSTVPTVPTNRRSIMTYRKTTKRRTRRAKRV